MVTAASGAQRRSRMRWRLGIGAGAVAVIAVVALAGGFGAVPRVKLPVYRPGQTFDNGVYAITVESAAVVDRDPFTDVETDRREVAVTATLRTYGDTAARQALRWLKPLGAGIEDSGFLRTARDGAAGPPIQPGLPVRVVYTWDLPADTALRPGDPIGIGVYERYEVEDAPIEGVTTDSVLVARFEPAS